MKQKKKHRAIKLTFSSSEYTDKEKLFNMLGSTALAALLFVAVSGLFISMFSIPVILPVPMLAGVAAIGAILFFEETEQKKKIIAAAAFAIGAVLLWLVSFKYSRAGFYVVINHIVTAFNIHSMTIMPQYETAVAEKLYGVCATLFLTPILVAAAALCAYIVKSSNRVLCGILLALLALLGVIESINHAGIWSALLCAAVVLLICRAFVCAADKGSSSTIMLAVCAVLLAACLVGSLLVIVLPGDALASLEKRLELNKASVMSIIHGMRYETNTYLAMPEGDFTEKNDYDITFETVLDVKMDKNESVYLRGYVGESYTDYGWRPLNKSILSDYTSLFYQLHKNGFYPQTQLADISNLLNKGEPEKPIKVEVKNRGACRAFIYAPYETISPEEKMLPKSYLGQSTFLQENFFGTENYSFTMLPNQVNRLYELEAQLESLSANPSKELEKYLAMETKYRSFVYSQYTDVPKEDGELISKYIGEGAVAGEKHISYKDAKSNILSVLEKQISYEENVARFNGDGSFIKYVLRDLQSGSSMHYATVAVMMLRHYGIPARYVEGYVITPDDAESFDDGDDIVLTDANAHAWAEYYHDGIGWLPFETIPTFAGVMEGASAPPEYMQPPSEGEAENDEQDPPEYNKNKSDKDKPKTPQEVFGLLVPWLLLLLFIALIMFGWWYRRKMIFASRLNDFEDRDNCAAVRAMMEYMLLLLSVCGIKDGINSAGGLICKVEEKWGEEWAAKFGRAMIICLEASFSSHIVERNEREYVYHTLKDIIEQVDKLQNKKSRFIIRYIKCIY